MRRYLILAVLGLAFLLTPAFLQSASAATTTAFYGPFPSWRQVQCGGADDTAMLQSELNVVGTDGHSPVLYIQPGTCRLTSTLHIDKEHGGCRYGGVSLLGADPATTRMLWAGPSDPNQPMLEYGCMFNSRFGRLTWDGGSSAQTVYWQSQVPEYSSGNRHEDEFFVNLSSSAVAIRSGGQGVGDSEAEYVRLHFIGPIEIDGQTLRSGEGVILATDIGNRDDAVFAEPDRLDVHRDARQHLAFGFGVHQCLGQPLARVELQVVYGTLYRRIPTLRLAADFDQIPFKHDGAIYGVYELPVTW